MNTEIIQIQRRLGLSIEPTNETCEKHGVMMYRLPSGLVCNECTREKIAEEDRLLARSAKIGERKNHTVRMLRDKSIVSDATLLDAEFSNYEVTIDEQRTNLEKAQEVTRRIAKGEHVTLWLVGTPGAGKSHLAMSILAVLNRHGENQLNKAIDQGLDIEKYGTAALFVSFDDMLRKIKHSFNDSDSIYTEEYFVNLCSKADVLVIDDLGAETGAIESGKVATDFVHRILYAIGTARQTKPTIITTNLRGAQRAHLYDAKILSRFKKHREEIIFIETPDHRDSEFDY